MTAQPDIAKLLQCLTEAQHRASNSHSAVLASYSLALPPCDHFEMFAANQRHEQPMTFWSIPRRKVSLLGVGCAHEFRAGVGTRWSDIQDRWQRLVEAAVVHGDHQPMLCGGFAFDAFGSHRSRWQDFPAAALTLAKFCLSMRGNETYLIINTLVGGASDCAALFEKATTDLAAIMSRRPPALRVESSPGLLEHDIAADTWKRKVAAAVATIQSGTMDKVVLARTRTVPLTLRVEDVLLNLSQTHPDAHVFAFARNGACFLGASPERLIEFRDGYLSTWALAGSAPRSVVASEDARLGSGLLRSVKDRHEHALVVKELRTVLARHCKQLDVPKEPSLLRLPHVQHLLTPIGGQADEGLRLLALLEQLHPSPAVGGFPRDAAIAYIRTQEELDRGWYAGPVGWIDGRGEGEFAVALRSALLRGDYATLFAGCGIVEGSSPDDEYRETEVKMRTMASALNGQPSVSRLYG